MAFHDRISATDVLEGRVRDRDLAVLPWGEVQRIGALGIPSQQQIPHHRPRPIRAGFGMTTKYNLARGEFIVLRVCESQFLQRRNLALEGMNFHPEK